jgi:hypothetical protein
MKPKQITKKLVLNKTTLSNLDNTEMRRVKGAEAFTQPTWDTWRTIEKICYINSCVECTWIPICNPTYLAC